MADDGTGVTKGIIHWDQATFPTPEDKVAYEKQQRPPMLDDESPRALRDAEVLGMSLAEVRALPTDPVALKAKLENRDNVGRDGVRRRAAVVRRHAARREGRAVQRAQGACRGAKLLPSVTDPLKRTGVGVQFEDEAWRTLFLFDPETGALLGTRRSGEEEVPGARSGLELAGDITRTNTAPETAR